MSEMRTRPRNPSPNYTQYHPQWYRPRISVYWWIGQWRYLRFILREISSVFVAIFVVMTILQLRALQHGADSYASFQEFLTSPAVLALNLICLAFVVFHAVTWFNLAPHALGLRIRGKPVPPFMISVPNYVAWLCVSALVAWMVWR